METSAHDDRANADRKDSTEWTLAMGACDDVSHNTPLDIFNLYHNSNGGLWLRRNRSPVQKSKPGFHMTAQFRNRELFFQRNMSLIRKSKEIIHPVQCKHGAYARYGNTASRSKKCIAHDHWAAHDHCAVIWKPGFRDQQLSFSEAILKER